MKYFDSHCHPQYPRFDADREEVLARMQEEGVGGLVVGTDLEMSRKGIELARRRDFLWAAIGLHPNDNLEEKFDAQAFAELVRDPKVVAIGECGLDYYRNEPTEEERAHQIERFERHIDLAIQTNKPLMIHCRPTRNSMNAHREMIEILQRHRDAKAIMHFFTGNAEITQQYLNLGVHISFPGVITFASEYDEVVRMVPLERMLSETDSPFAAPKPHRGKRNEPSFVIETVKKIAELKNLPLEETASQIILNSQRIFGFSQ